MTQQEIDALRDKTPIGERVMYRQPGPIEEDGPKMLPGKIVGKYRDVFTIMTAGGLIRAYQWKELLMETGRTIALKG